MLLTSRSVARRAGSLVATLGVLLAMVLVASPAQAAPVVNLSVVGGDTTVAIGESVTLQWTSADTTELSASGAWTGSKALNGSEPVSHAAAGSYTYTLTADNDSDSDDPDSDSVTITVAPGPITPNAVTFPDDCTVVVPTTANVTYFVDYGDGDTEELEAGEYDGTEFSGGDTVTFFAEANDGFTLADGATTEWDYAAADSCFDINEGPELVSTTVECGSITFTNTTDESIYVEAYGFSDEVDFELVDDFNLAGGASRTVETDFEEILFGAFTESDAEDEPTQIRYLEVPQDCDGGSGDGDGDGNGDGSDHPTTAPAAGIAPR